MAASLQKLLDVGTKIVAVGRNYAAHAKELGNAVPKECLNRGRITKKMSRSLTSMNKRLAGRFSANTLGSLDLIFIPCGGLFFKDEIRSYRRIVKFVEDYNSFSLKVFGPEKNQPDSVYGHDSMIEMNSLNAEYGAIPARWLARAGCSGYSFHFSNNDTSLY